MKNLKKVLSKMGYAAAIDENDIFEAINFAYANGMKAVELSMNVAAFLPCKYNLEQRTAIKKLADEKGIKLSLHGPENVSFLNIQPKLIASAIELYKEILDFAVDIGADRITLHVGDNVCYTLTDKKVLLHELQPEVYRDILYKSLREIRDYSIGKAMICVENTGKFDSFLAECLDSLLKEGNLYLTFDWGHSYGKDIQRDFMLTHKEYIRNCHVHDNNGKSDHQTVFTGNVPLMEYFELLCDNDLNFILEIRPRNMAAKSFEILKNTF